MNHKKPKKSGETVPLKSDLSAQDDKLANRGSEEEAQKGVKVPTVDSKRRRLI